MALNYATVSRYEKALSVMAPNAMARSHVARVRRAKQARLSYAGPMPAPEPRATTLPPATPGATFLVSKCDSLQPPDRQTLSFPATSPT